MPERPKEPKLFDFAALTDRSVSFDLKTAESPDERASRLRRGEAEAEHQLRTQEADDCHKRRISLLVHLFVMTVVGVAFLASLYIATVKDPKTGLPDKAMNVITAIVAAGVGYITGKGSK